MHARRISGLHKRASVLPGMHSSRRDASVAEEEEIIKRPNPVTLPDSLETVEIGLSKRIQTSLSLSAITSMRWKSTKHYSPTFANPNLMDQTMQLSQSVNKCVTCLSTHYTG